MQQSGGFGRRGVRTEASNNSPPAAAPAPAPQKSPLIVALSLVLGVLGFAGGAWFGQEAVQQLFAARASNEIDQRLADMKQAARAKYPDLDPVEALSRYARETTPAMVAASKSDRERVVKAAATFFGFYHINTRSRVEHCASLGVDIGPFARLMERNHRHEYARALAVAQDAGMTEERLWSMIRSQLDQMVRADMDSIARRIMTSPAGACQIVVDRADEFAAKLDFATMQPEVQRILMGS